VDWSTKASGVPIQPHLSTVDMLLVAVQMAELDLRHGFGITADSIRQARVRRATIMAGQRPQERLRDHEVKSTCRESVPLVSGSPGSPGSPVGRSSYECHTGSLRATCDIEHPQAPESTRRVASFPALSDALAPAGQRYYGDGYKNDRHVIEDVGLDMVRMTASGRAIFTSSHSHAASEGIEGDSRRTPTLVDAFVVCMQLAQVLIYELDAITRAESATLWMLRTHLIGPDDIGHAAMSSGIAEVSITSAHLIPLRGERWRNVDLAGAIGGVRMQASFAHRLPPGPSSRGS
jgi:hypothetical protein